MTNKHALIALGMLLSAPSAVAVDPSELLPVDDAFAIRAEALDAQTVLVQWDIAEGYYMYRGRIGFETDDPGVTLAEPLLPRGEPKVDEFFGEVETFRDRVDVEVQVNNVSGNVLNLVARSQGCADVGVCYPPHRQEVAVRMPAAAASSPLGDVFGAAAPAGLDLLNPATNDALPEDEAFRFEAIDGGPNEILVRYTIAPGYYMYRDKFSFSLRGDEGLSLLPLALPPGAPMVDEHFGDVQVFRDLLEFTLDVQRLHGDLADVELEANYQGCKEAGICYPPMTRVVALTLPEGGRVTSAAAAADPPRPVSRPAISEQSRLAAALGGDEQWLTLLTFFGLGLLLTFTPCVFPMIPILAGIIAGQGESITTRRAFALSMIYVLAMALTYTLAGVIAGMFGYNLQAAFQNAWVLAAFSAIFVALALAMFGFYDLQLPASWQSRLNEISGRRGGGSLSGAAIMGFLSALIVGPCVAPPLMGALIYIGQTGDPVLGGLALFCLALGMGLPLVIFGTSAGRYLPRAGAWMDAVKAVFGVALLGLAIWMLERVLPPHIVMVLWGLLALSVAVYLRAFDHLPDDASGWRRLWKALGLALAFFAALQLIGAAAGGRDWQQPLKGVFAGGGAPAVDEVSFQYVRSSAELDEELARAAARNQPVLLDYYADWCVDCKRMEKYTFPEPVVQRALEGVLLLKADVTDNNQADQTLLKRFGLIGPPATLFFDRSGRELPGYRLVGYQKPEAFAAHIKEAFTP